MDMEFDAFFANTQNYVGGFRNITFIDLLVNKHRNKSFITVHTEHKRAQETTREDLIGTS